MYTNVDYDAVNDNHEHFDHDDNHDHIGDNDGDTWEWRIQWEDPWCHQSAQAEPPWSPWNYWDHTDHFHTCHDFFYPSSPLSSKYQDVLIYIISQSTSYHNITIFLIVIMIIYQPKLSLHVMKILWPCYSLSQLSWSLLSYSPSNDFDPLDLDYCENHHQDHPVFITFWSFSTTS